MTRLPDSTLALALLLAALGWPAAAEELRLNQIQIIGSHNSYHAGLAPGEFTLLRQRAPKDAGSLEYHHPPLDQQLSAGVRQLELDIFADSRGGLYAHPNGIRQVQKAGLPADPPFDPEGKMNGPGFKVMHMLDVDYRSTCQPFTGCLGVIRAWSQAHPRHLPIFVIVENKYDKPRPGSHSRAERFTAASFDALDAEIRSVFGKEELITPDDVRGSHATLEEAVLAGGWPTLEAARGKVIFLLDQKKAGPLYRRGHPALEGRVLFTNSTPGSPDAAFIEVNEPLPDTSLIPSLVRKGYLVRSRTDEPTAQARANDTRQREAAMASGAQILSTDYPFQEAATWTGFSVNFPEGGIARCNPVLKPANCSADALAEPK